MEFLGSVKKMKSDGIKEAANIFTVRDKKIPIDKNVQNHRAPYLMYVFLLKPSTAVLWHPIFVYNPRNSVILPCF
jgi:hypothetical protein